MNASESHALLDGAQSARFSVAVTERLYDEASATAMAEGLKLQVWLRRSVMVAIEEHRKTGGPAGE